MDITIKKLPILIIYGATGVGKTDLALAIADAIPVEIVNIDVGQFYEPFSIGTAKPDWKNHPVPHHLFDILAKQTSLTVAQYYIMVTDVISEIIARGNIPLLVGGSTFYVHSLLFPPNMHNHLSDVRNDSTITWDMLYAIDPQRAQKIDKNDQYRIDRAYTLWKSTGKLPTFFAPRYNPIADFILIYAYRDTDILNAIINKRVQMMMKLGWIKETKQLLETGWKEFIEKKKLIGYNDIVTFLDGDQDALSLENTIETICAKTRQYAKRQRTFWRKLEREIKHQDIRDGFAIGSIEQLDLTNLNLQLYINELSKRLSLRVKK